MLYVPRHLPNKLEYKVLSCISVHYQSRMASNGIAITPPHPLTVQAGQSRMGGGGGLRANVYAACSVCGCGFVLGRRGQLSRRSSIQVDEISCIRDHPRILLVGHI